MTATLVRIFGALMLRSIMAVAPVQQAIGRLLVCVPLAHSSATGFAIRTATIAGCRPGIADSIPSPTMRAIVYLVRNGPVRVWHREIKRSKGGVLTEVPSGFRHALSKRWPSQLNVKCHRARRRHRRCHLKGAENSVRLHFTGSSWTNDCLPVNRHVGCPRSKHNGAPKLICGRGCRVRVGND